MRPYEEFCEVRIITYCVMSNHLHVFVEVLQRPAQVPDDTEPLAKLKRLCSPGAFAQIRLQLENLAVSVQSRKRYAGHFPADVGRMVRARLLAWHEHSRSGGPGEDDFREALE